VSNEALVMQDARGRARPKIEQICADLRMDLMGRHQKILISADHTTKKMLQEAVEACASRVEASAACLLQIRKRPFGSDGSDVSDSGGVASPDSLSSVSSDSEFDKARRPNERCVVSSCMAESTSCGAGCTCELFGLKGIMWTTATAPNTPNFRD